MNCRLILVLGALAAIPSARAQYLFNALAPCRITDTRGTGNPITTTERDIQMSGGCGIPSSSAAFSINVTAIGASSTAPNSLAVWPTGQPNQGLATLYFGHSAIPAGAVIAPAGTGANSGKIALNTLRNVSTTDALIDVNGYFGTGSSGLAFYPITPCRVVDTRSWAGKTGAFGPPSLAAYSGRDFPLSSPSAGCGVPTNAVAYSLNVTAVPQGTLSFLSIWQTGQPYPSVSTLNSPDGSMVANAAIVAAGTNGSVTVVSGNPTDLILDVNGYFAPPVSGGLYFYPLPPCRVVDTGRNPPLGGTYLAAYSGKTFQIGGVPNGLCNVPTSAQAYSLNVTALPKQGYLDFLTVWPSGAAYPYVSTLNDTDGYTIANVAIVGAGSSSGIQMVAGYPTDVIVDVNGYFSLNANEGSYVNVTGARDTGSQGQNLPQQYTLHFTNTSADVVYGQVLFTTASQPSGTYACQIEWNSAGNLNLISPNLNVDGSFSQGGTLSDSTIPCSVDALHSTKTQTGSGFDISLWITFASGFNGSSVQAFAYGENSQGLASLWLQTSSWVIGSQYYLNTQASPFADGTISPTPGWHYNGEQVTVTATPNSGYQFVNFTGDLSGSTTPQPLIVNGPKTVTANFQNPIISITVSPYHSWPLIVDGVQCTASCVFVWPTLSTHTISAVSPRASGGVVYNFSSWSDGGAQTHTITVNASTAIYTAYYTTQGGGQGGPSGNCDTLVYGGAPDGQGAFISYASTAYRLNGNEVYMSSYTGVSGSNAGLIIANITTYYYRNNSLINARTVTSPSYGATVYGDQFQTLYSGGQYYLGTFQLGNPTAVQNHHWGTSPVCAGLGYPTISKDYYDSSNTYAAVKPTITGPGASSSASIWYLGGAPSIDGYYTQTVLTGNANWGTAPPLYWTVTQGTSKVSLSASVAAQNTVTSLAPSASSPTAGYVYDVNVQITTDGLPSAPFPITINAPSSIARRDLGPQFDPYGWENDFAYMILDPVGNQLTPITLHETFENFKLIPPFDSGLPPADPNYSNWVLYPPPPATVWKASDAGDPTKWTVGNEFIDHVFAEDRPPGTLIPTPVTFSSSPRAVTDISQKFFIGGPTADTFVGQCVYVGKLTYFTDHGEASGTSPVGAGGCAQGVFGN